MRALFVAAGFAMISGQALAGHLALGPSSWFPTSAVDHAKYGASLSAGFRIFGLPLDLGAELGFSTFDAVNPGAGNNPTAPDEEESFSGGFPFYGHLSTDSGSRLLGAALGLGVQSYWTQFTQQAAAVPAAASVFLDWSLLKGSLSADLGLAAGVQVTDFAPITLLASPELKLHWMITGSFGLRAEAGLVTVQAFSSPSVSFLHPRAALRLGIGI